MNIKKAKISLRALLQFLLKQKVNDRDDWIALRQTKDVLELLRNKHIRHGYYVCGQILPSECTKRKKIKYTAYLEHKTISYVKIGSFLMKRNQRYLLSLFFYILCRKLEKLRK